MDADPNRAGPAIRWARILTEAIVIVASILFAFAIDAWWDGHRERVRERELLADLLTEFEESRAELEVRVVLARRMASGTERLTGVVSAGAGKTAILVPDSVVLAALGAPTYEPATNALEAALGSGEIALILNREIRSELAAWRRALLDTAEDEAEVRRITSEQVVPLLATAMNVAPYLSRLLDWSFERPVEGLPGQASLRPSTELAGALALRQFYVEFSATDLADLLGILERTVVLLDSELSR